MKIRGMACLIALALCLPTTRAAEPQNIVETAVAAGSFKTLAAALEAADLVDALQGKGPFTVFAPTDEAFAKLPQGVIADLLKPENKAKLAGILTYHVVPGKVMASQVVKLAGAKTLNGQRIDISASGDGVTVNNANVVKTDIECTNGVIHVIDSVILPEANNIPTVASNAKAFTTLLAAAKAAGLVEALSGKGPLTVFAPTDEAFAKLPAATLKSLLLPENKGKLAAILKYHVVAGRVYSEDAVKAKSASTLEGQNISISVTPDGAMINEAKLLTTDIDASNGVIHVIDSVLLPPAKNAAAPFDCRTMIEGVVAKGSHMFNAGHHGACAELYMQAMTTMMQYSDQMPTTIVSHVQHTMASAEQMTSATDKAWALRRGLDQVYLSWAARN